MLINHWVGGILFLVKPICSGWNCGRDRWHLKSVLPFFHGCCSSLQCSNCPQLISKVTAVHTPWSRVWCTGPSISHCHRLNSSLFWSNGGWPQKQNIFVEEIWRKPGSSTCSMLQFTAGWRIPVHRRLANLATETEMAFKSKQHWEIWGFRFPLQKGFPVCINIALNPSIFHLSY